MITWPNATTILLYQAGLASLAPGYSSVTHQHTPATASAVGKVPLLHHKSRTSFDEQTSSRLLMFLYHCFSASQTACGHFPVCCKD
jgi:hypothetical protein